MPHHKRRITPPFLIDVRTTLAGVQCGADDPTLRFPRSGGAWRATRTPDGPATLHLSATHDAVDAEAWGDGADWALEQAPALIGCLDDDHGFDERDPVVERLHRRMAGFRLARTDNLFEALVPAVLEHGVPAYEATRSFRQVLRAYGEPAPGPGGLVVPPHPDELASVPLYDLHVCGVERALADILVRVCAHARRLPQFLELPSAEAQRRLCELPGVDASTAGQAVATAFGDPDVVRLGDPNLPALVSWFFTGDTTADDQQMLELLEPWRGQRRRVVAMFEASGMRPPRAAARTPLAPSAP